MIPKSPLRNSSARLPALVAIVLIILCQAPIVVAGFFRNRAVGGISIDTDGVLKQATSEDTRQLLEATRIEINDVPDELSQANKLRKVSLRQLEQAISKLPSKDVRMLPDEIKYLAGIQRIQYIFVYPDQHDIVLAGPGEGWTVDSKGTVVGIQSGRPVVLLEDLLVALRSTDAARSGGISCSIDPTPQGRTAMRQLIQKQKRFTPAIIDQIEQALGPQQITLTGVPEATHFARILVAADYRMKRIAMQLEESPVKGLNSYLSMLQKSRSKLTDMMPRWWLACDYEPLAKSSDGLAWELRGQGVKAMTEDEIVLADGTTEETGKTSPLAQEWAERMTAHFDELAKAEPIFGQLRNVMDACVVAALIDHERLLEKAACQLPLLMGDEVALQAYNAPRTIDSQCSFVKRGREYIITASGGVMIESWSAAARSQESPHVEKLRQDTGYNSSTNWWWN
jgi:hypothetical protein